MPETRQLSDLSRQELYELIWSSSALKVAAEFGLSDVAVHKRCIKLNVPRPTRGYWAKIAAGHKPRKKPLPPTADEVFEQEVKKRVIKTLALPDAEGQLNPLALELLQVLRKQKPDTEKKIHVQAPPFPEVTISKPVADRVAKAFHVILNGLEPLGILFKKSQSSYRSGHFRRTNDRIILHIDETLIDRFGKEQRVNSWQWREGGTPSGRLNFLFKTDFYGKRDDEKEWTETPKVPLEKLLPQIIVGMRLYFLDCQKRRIQEEIVRKQQHAEWERRQREWEAKEEIRIEKERKLNHENAIKSVVTTRKLDLIKGVEWWRVWKNATEFIDECERRWTSSGGGLNTDHITWLAWARDVAKTLSPFEAGYPEPTKHGAFDSAAINLGGPYPSSQNFPQPPTMRST